MSFQEFLQSCAAGASEPAGLSAALRALRMDKLGDWDRAHQITQEGDTREGAWVHAYLHRKEGDLSNARYWYSRAGKPESSESLEAEWEAIARVLAG